MKTSLARWTLAAAATFTVGATLADDTNSLHHQRPDYRVVNLAALGGSENAGNSINDLNLVGGYANLPDNNSRHAMLWLYGFPFELGTLGGPNSAIVWPAKNSIGLVTGIAQTTTPQPRGETWSCRSFFATPTRAAATCLGVVWEEGRIRALPTFGGDNGFATGANNHRQVVGWAENTVQDSTCVAPQVLQFRAALWGPGKDEMRELPPLGNDRTSAATAINDKGQVVGISGACGTAVGSVSAEHMVMWDNGRTISLGTFGGVAWNTPMALNEHGDVVGFANLSKADGTSFNAQAFRWTRGRGLENLGVLPGDSLSQALGINDKGQIVGLSCTAGFGSCRAFLYDHGVMMDLNQLVQDDYGDTLYTANDINNNGQIAGYALKAGTGEQIPVWLYPLERHGHGNSDAVAKNDAARVPLPAAARQRILQRAFASEAQLGK